MKKLIYAFVAMCFIYPLILNAQTEKGKMLLGVSSRFSVLYLDKGPDIMSFGFSSQKYKSDDPNYEDEEADKISSINISPRYGYFIIDNLALGIDFSLASWIMKSGGSDYKDTWTIFSAGPFARYYFTTKNVLPFLEGYAVFGTAISKSTGGGDDYTDKSGISAYGGGLGLAIPIGEKAAFDFMFGYNSSKIKDKEDNEDNTRSITGTFGIRFGFVIFLGKN
jgi:hypothetical protein